MEEGIQQKLIGNNITTTTRELPDNGWKVLTQFYLTRGSLSFKELQFMVNDKMHFNTTRFMVTELEMRGFIRIVALNVGKTRRSKRWQITDQGVNAWETHQSK